MFRLKRRGASAAIRHVFSSFMVAVAALMIAFPGSIARAQEPQTVEYKRIGDLAIQLDVYLPPDETPDAAVVWIHGGALINGHREGIPGQLRQVMLERGFALVSIDYRLAPETKLPEIIEDVVDACRWVQTDGSRRYGWDQDRMAVAGGSAGGYLTLVTGYRVQPPPRALVAFWGYGDVTGPWYAEPSPHPRHHRVRMDADEAWAQVSGPVIADSRERQGNGGAFYQFCRQQGLWPRAVTGWDPRDQRQLFEPFEPVRQVTENYPPTLLIHGTEDTDVPHSLSVDMAAQFEAHSVEHRLISVEGGEHGLAGADRADIEAANEAAFDFLESHLRD